MKKHRLVMTGLALVLCLLLPWGQTKPAFASSYVVNTTDDSDDGVCNSTHCSLREAIHLANSHPGGDYIHILIVGDDPGCDGTVCTITLGLNLPAIKDTTGGTFVDGTSQPDTNPDGPDVVINGSAGSYTCLSVESQYNTITGFVINECLMGILVSGNYNTISGNYLGTNHTGTAAAGNSYGIRINNGYENTIGGTTAAERNIISGSNNAGVEIQGSYSYDNTVIGNYIGTNADGTGAIANGYGGINITYDAHDNIIGGPNPGEPNVISGNHTGICIQQGACDNEILGNYIGTDASGTHALPNNHQGVVLSSGAHDNLIGGTIAYNAWNGVRVDGAASTGNTINARSIHSNGNLGIDLSDGGNGGILPPVITTASCNSASGTAPAGYGIRLFSDREDEGRQYHWWDVADGSGAWSVTLPSGLFTYRNLTATATDSAGNTSEFSPEVPNGCQYLWMPLGLKGY
jgi:CSLREA domain-containing protein